MPADLNLDTQLSEVANATGSAPGWASKVITLAQAAFGAGNPFGTAATKNTGTAAGEVPVLTGEAEVDVSLLPAASTTGAGVVRRATAAEITAGTSTEAVPSVSQVQALAGGGSGLRIERVALTTTTEDFHGGQSVNEGAYIEIDNSAAGTILDAAPSLAGARFLIVGWNSPGGDTLTGGGYEPESQRCFSAILPLHEQFFYTDPLAQMLENTGGYVILSGGGPAILGQAPNPQGGQWDLGVYGLAGLPSTSLRFRGFSTSNPPRVQEVLAVY